VDSSDELFLGRPFGLDEVRRAKLTRADHRRLRAQGVIRPVLHGVYVDAGVADTIELRAAALSLVAPAGSVCCDRTAAWLHGVDILAERDPLWLPPLEIYRTDGRDGLRRSGCSRGKRALEYSRDVVEIAGVLVTTPVRTALDLGRLLRRRDAFIALNAIARHGTFGRLDVVGELSRFRGMRGVVQLRSLVALMRPEVESPAESVTLLQLIDAGLPMPECQFPILNRAGVIVYRLDFAYGSLMLAIEYDGEDWHTTAEQQARDKARRRHLEDLGWSFVILTKDDVFGPHPRAAGLVRAAVEAKIAAQPAA
jgi:hypothetical protein